VLATLWGLCVILHTVVDVAQQGREEDEDPVLRDGARAR
jgi:hypothetical protein